MAYTTQAHVQTVAGGSDALRELSDFESAGAIDEDVVTQAITDADGWMDTFIQKRYAVPLTGDDITPAVAACAANEAVYLMRQWRTMATAEDDENHAKREALLTAFANGANVLGIVPLPVKSSLVADNNLPLSSSAAEDDTSITRQRERWKGFY